jgi:hypothetical protein
MVDTKVALTLHESLPSDALYLAAPNRGLVSVACSPEVEPLVLSLLRQDIGLGIADAIEARKEAS